MIVLELIFYAFSLVLVFASVAVITVRNPIYAVLFLVLAFFTASGIWMLLEAEFLAIILIVVYVGAVMVLFLFVVMMLDINLVPFKEGFSRYLPVAVLVAVAMGVANGFLVGYLKVPSFIGTFASSFVWLGLAIMVRPTPGGSIPRSMILMMIYCQMAFISLLL